MYNIDEGISGYFNNKEICGLIPDYDSSWMISTSEDKCTQAANLYINNKLTLGYIRYRKDEKSNWSVWYMINIGS